MSPIETPGPKKPSGWDWIGSHQDKVFAIIAVFCVIFTVVEVFGKIGGDSAKIVILVGLAIVALLAPRIRNVSIGADGIAAELTEKLDTSNEKLDRNNEKIEKSKSATIESDREINQKIEQIYLEIRRINTTGGGNGVGIAVSQDGA